MSNTICLKLTSGEEIIAQTHQLIDPNNRRSYDISVVRSILVQPMANNQMAIGFVPWMVGNTDATITIHAECIIAAYEPESNIERGYLQQTSGIALDTMKNGVIQV